VGLNTRNGTGLKGNQFASGLGQADNQEKPGTGRERLKLSFV